jgi:hypothetical protein
MQITTKFSKGDKVHVVKEKKVTKNIYTVVSIYVRDLEHVTSVQYALRNEDGNHIYPNEDDVVAAK